MPRQVGVDGYEPVALPVFLADIGCTEHPGDQRVWQYVRLLARVSQRHKQTYWAAVAVVRAKNLRVPSRDERQRLLRKPHARAVQLLLEAGHELPLSDSDLVAATRLSAIADKRGGSRWNFIVRRIDGARRAGNAVPDADAIVSHWQTRRAQRARYNERRLDRIAPEMAEIAKRDAEAVRAYVASVRRESGEGPTWSEVTRAMGWPYGPSGAQIAIPLLIGSGKLVAVDGVSRSLAVS